MKMMAHEFIGAKVAPSTVSPIGKLYLSDAPKCVADFAHALRRIDQDYTRHMVDGMSEEAGFHMFNDAEMYQEWYAKELGAQFPEDVVQLFGEAEADDFENAFIDSETLEDYMNLAHGAARAAIMDNLASVAEEECDKQVISQDKAGEACIMVTESAIESLADVLNVDIDFDYIDQNAIKVIEQGLLDMLRPYATLEAG